MNTEIPYHAWRWWSQFLDLTSVSIFKSQASQNWLFSDIADLLLNYIDLPTNKSSCLQGTGHWRCPGVGRSSSGLYGGDKTFQDLVETPGVVSLGVAHLTPSENGFEECWLRTGGTAWIFTLPLLKICWCGRSLYFTLIVSDAPSILPA